MTTSSKQIENLIRRLRKAEAERDRARDALRIADKWLDLNYGYLKPESDPLLVEFANAVRAALGDKPT